jgi:hypothetical protein
MAGQSTGADQVERPDAQERQEHQRLELPGQ